MLAFLVASVLTDPSALAAKGVPATAPALTPRDPVLGTTDLRSKGVNARALRALDAEAEATGAASTVIALPLSFTPEALLTADESAQQRAETIRHQDALVADLERLGAVSTRRYGTMPYVAASLPRAALAALSSLKSAGEVAVDQVAGITLAESTVLVQSVMAVGHGFGGVGQTVAVIDTGVDGTHPFLASKVVSEACYSQGGGCPGGSKQSIGPGAGVPCPTDAACRHGTHVAGIVAGRRPAGGSFDGVAPSATIISINVFSSCGAGCLTTTTSDMMSALERVYALKDTFSIAAVNLSIGTTTTYTSPCDSDPLKAAIDTLRAVGIPTVIASGNSSSFTGISSPGCISTAVTVGSTTDVAPVDQVSWFSNSASFLDLLAPGEGITSSVPGGGYEQLSGTSMAAPHVAGAWASLKQQNPSLSVTDGLARLQSTGLPVTDARNGVTKGRIRLLDALTPGAPSNVSATAANRAASVSFSAPAGIGAPVSGYVVTASPGGALVLGLSSPVTVTGLTNGTAYTFTVHATNSAGDSAESGSSSSVTPATTPAAPTIGPATRGNGSATVTWTPPADTGGATVTGYTVTSSGGPTATVNGATFSTTVTGLSNGTAYTFTVHATNSVGDSAESGSSNSVTPATTPAAPPIGPATAPPDTTTAGPRGPVGTRQRSGYWMVGSDGTVYAFGDARSYGNALVGSAPAVDLEPTPSGNGYWIVDDHGRVFPFGDAASMGNVAPGQLTTGEMVTSLSATRSGGGYWIFTSKGRVLTFGDAPFLGDVSTLTLNGPVRDSITTPSGAGYYMVASDGGIFAFGDADFSGSMGGAHLNAPVQSLVPDSDAVGYWLVASDGGIFAFDADFNGSMGGTTLNRPITGMVRSGRGYLMVGEDGGLFDFSGSAAFQGSLGASPPAQPIVSVAVLAV